MADFADVVNELKETNKKLDNLTKAADPKGAAAAEDKRDAANAAARSEGYLKTIADAMTGATKGDGLDPKDKKKGGLLAGIGGALGGLGIGAGVAMGGLGALFAGGGLLLKQLAEFDGKKVVANVRELFKIAELTTGIGDAFVKGGSFLVAMTGIGLGLAVFGVGAGVGSLGIGLANFIDPKWAQTIVDNVVILLSLSKAVGGVGDLLKDGGAFTLAMTGIGIGLGVFGAGAALAGLSQFIVKDDWATKVKNRVVTLLSIKDSLGSNWEMVKSGGAFGLSMAGIAAGLAAFAVGQAASGLAQFLVKEDLLPDGFLHNVSNSIRNS